MAAPENVVRLDDEFASFDEQWKPRIVGQINEMDIKVVKLQGEFVWHTHKDTDEFFLVQSGHMTIRMKGREDVVVGPNEFFVVPRGKEHCPSAAEECEVVLLEPAGLVNTGDAATSDRTAPTDEWI